MSDSQNLEIFTGNFSYDDMKKIKNILEYNNNIETYISNDNLFKLPTVVNKETEETEYNPKRRTGKRYTFNNEIVKELEEILLPGLINNYIYRYIKFEQTHGDVLYYDTNDEFKWHKDTIPECPYDNYINNFKYYTLLLGLYTTKSGGETSIVLEDNNIHDFAESCTYGNFLLFPSDLHLLTFKTPTFYNLYFFGFLNLLCFFGLYFTYLLYEPLNMFL